MNKRGLSHVIAMLLIMMLAVASVILIWNIYNIVFRVGGEKAEAQNFLFQERMDITRAIYTGDNHVIITLTIRKEGGIEFPLGDEIVLIPPPPIDLVSVSDLSGSMGGEKMEASKEAHNLLIEAVLNNTEFDNNIGLSAYSSNELPLSSHELSSDNVSLSNIVDSWNAIGATCVCCGINYAVNEIYSSSSFEKKKVMLVMSDGIANRRCSDQGTSNAKDDAILAACQAKETLNNLTIYSIGFGDDVDAVMMGEIADCGGGEYFFADVDTILEIYLGILEEATTEYEAIRISAGLKLVFYSDSDQFVRFIEDPPIDIFEAKIYEYDLAVLEGDLERIELYAVVFTSSGDEIVGPLLDVWVFD